MDNNMLNGAPSLHPITLRFDDNELELSYQKIHSGWMPKNARLALLLAASLIAVFGLIDPVLMPENVDALLKHRVFVVSLFLAMLAFTFHPLFARFDQYSAWVSGLIGCYAVVMLPAIVSLEHGYTYYVGILLAPAFFFSFLGLRFIHAIFLTAILIVSYNSVVIMKGIPFGMLLNNNFFVIGISIIAAISGYIMEKQQRTVFYKSYIVKNLKLEAEEANQSKSKFFASMSHELRTPLNAIIGYSEMMLEDELESGSGEKTKDLYSIGIAGQHLLRLINNILDLAKMEEGKLELAIEETSLADILELVSATIQPLVKSNNNNFVIKVEEFSDKFYADSMRLQQILINVLSNACKFTKDGEINLLVQRVDESIVFTISDSGIGMNNEHLATLFDEYSQGSPKTAHTYGGSGLGLSITKHLVELMDGSITVESQPEHGSVFSVTLPIKEPM